jgi:glycosyltransferase involved in cell wall biosynthesis
MDIHLFGSYPPPYGGVSVHVSRLAKHLRRDGHHVCVWCDRNDTALGLRALPRRGQLRTIMKATRPDSILHFHGNHLLAGRLARRRHVVFTVHNERINTTFRGGASLKARVRNMLAKHYFARVRHLIAISAWVKDSLVEFGFPPSAIDVAHSYLKPEPSEEPHPENMRLLETFSATHPVLASANAWALKFHEGEDLYGIDLCVRALKKLQPTHPGLGMVLAVPLGRGSEYLTQMQNLAAELDVADDVLWLLEPGAYHPILDRCDVFLRPTNTEGFGVSIVEAFDVGLPVVASDAAKRPEACVVFKNRDADDLAEKIAWTLEHRDDVAARSRANQFEDSYHDILNVYHRMLGRDPAESTP